MTALEKLDLVALGVQKWTRDRRRAYEALVKLLSKEVKHGD